ncbi:alpha/beta hydrolase [Actinacidiphila glaucinigra]|uniref:Alpha/beta hydrolase fold n=1 Tax=Actinacidiphila glaucinigra TaxID=235986 RepID=A0A239D3I2_9ACTN|nr:alpha/beta hydrolase [Actinacidiphila glaucinigra]SNS26598.1 alpha/beta hydrolase fold [Actinacidiphila glaucinigra]
MKAVPASGRIPRRGLICTLAVLVAFGLLLATCTAVRHSGGTAGPVPTATASASASDAAIRVDLRRYYTQNPRWRPCPERSFQCASLRVPRDYAHPEAGDIALSAILRPATGRGAARIGALQINPGGPGLSAVDDLLAYADSYSPSLRAAYDLVAVDPRGVGHSTPVECGATGLPGAGTRGTPSSDEAAIIDTWAAYHAEVAEDCARRAGRLLPHVGTLDAARDMDVVRAVLGEDRLHFLGFSYGTYLGATYAELFPSRVGRVVLDGAVDPAMDGYHAYLNQARGYQIAWDSFAADCAGRGRCPVGHSVEEAGRTLDALVAALDRAPLRQGKDDRLDGEALLGAVVTALRAPDWETLRSLLDGVRAGDATVLRELVGSEDDATGDESMTAVNCLSSALESRSTPAQTLAALPEFRRASPQFGAFYNEDLSTCAHWPARPTQVPRRVSAHGAGPILVLGTTRDPATPYDQARALAGQLSSGRLLTWDGDGHTAYQRGSRCVDTAVDDYLLHGLLPPSGAVCR